MRKAGLRSDRGSAVAVMFAIMAVPILGMAGLAIDYSIWNETYASLSLTASSAAFNAAKIAATADVQNDAISGPKVSPPGSNGSRRNSARAHCSPT